MILPLAAFSIFPNLPRSGLSYINVGHAFIVQALDLPRIHGRSFSAMRVCARRGSPPRSTGLAKQRRASLTVAPARHQPLTQAAWARPGARSISLATNLVAMTHATNHLPHAPGAARVRQRNCNFQATHPETADDSHRRRVVLPWLHCAHPDAQMTAGLVSSSGWRREQRRYRGRWLGLVRSFPRTAAEASTTWPCPG